MTPLRIAFAGDRDISVQVLQFVLQQGIRPLALMVSNPSRATHAVELRELCNYLPEGYVFVGKEFRSPPAIAKMRNLDLDFIIAVHFPYIVPHEVLTIPQIGVLNLHPAYLPYNRGWHTPSWAILEDTPIGATLHFMDEGIDTGDVIYQRKIEILPNDTADTLYRRLKQLEFNVFKEAWPLIVEKRITRHAQNLKVGTSHQRKDLFRPEIQLIELEKDVKAGELLKKLRALTTNRLDEAAYFEVNGQRYRVQVRILKEKEGDE